MPVFLAVGRAYDLPVTALRFFNAYGPRQALSNPYTGVAAIFASALAAGAVDAAIRWKTDAVPLHSDVSRANRTGTTAAS